MKTIRSILLFAALAVGLRGAVGDITLQQMTNVTPPAYATRVIGAGTSSLWGFNSTGVPVRITIGAGISYDTGTNTISVAAGGGNVSNVGTPLNSQIAVWTGATTIKGVIIGSGLNYDGTTLTATATGAGTVTSVSVVTANGVSGSVATATTTPAITLTLGAITPSSVNSVVISGSSTPTLAVTGTTTVSGANTGDQTNITGNAGTASKLATARTIAITGDFTWTSPAFDGSANVTAAGTLATVATAGTTGSSTAIPVITIDVKGRTTSITTAVVVAPAGTLTGATLASNVTGSSLTALGTITALVATTINGNTFTTGTGTLTLGAGKVATISNTLTFTGTDTASVAFGTGGTVLYSGGSYVASLTGTANEITVSGATGAVTLSLPTALTFTGKTVTGGTFASPTLTTPALGTPASGVLTNATGYAVANLSGAGTGVLTALAVNVGSAGAFVTFNGAGGTPSSITLTNASGTAASLTAGTASAVAVGGITGLGTGVGTFLATPSSANLAGALTDETGSGVAMFGTSPAVTTSLTTPSTTFALLNTTATTVNAFGAATTVNTGASATQIWNFGGSTTASEFRFLEPSGSGTNYSAFKAVAQGANITYSLPATVGAAGTFLHDSAGNGVLDWAAPAGAGTVTVVGSGNLTSTALVTGGGSQTIQTPAATATMDASGNISTPGSITAGAGGSVAGYLALGQGTAPSAGTTNITLYAPASVTSYIRTFPGAAGTGFYLGTNSAGVVTDTQVASNGTGNVLLAAGTIAITTGKTVTFDHTSTFTTTDSAVYTFPAATATIARTDAANTFVGASTGTNWTLTTPTLTGGTLTGLTGLAVRDTSAAFDLTLAATSSTALTAGRTLTLDVVNAARTLKLTGNPTLADWFDQSVKAAASPTFVTVTAALSGNATTASTLATTRSIYGNNFDGSAALGQIIASTYGGTGNGFTKFSGPATTEKTFTLPNASAAVLTDNAAVTVAQGGTGLATLTLNNVILGNGTSTPLFVAPGTSGNVLTSNGTTWTSAAAAGGTPANPTGTIALTAVNGSASTYMRSDGAPALGVTITPTWSGVHTWTLTQAANTSADGTVLADTTAASAGNQQYSPRIRLTGQGWKTNATAGSQTVDWTMETRPVQGASAPNTLLVFSGRVNGGAYIDGLTINYLTGDITDANANVLLTTNNTATVSGKTMGSATVATTQTAGVANTTLSTTAYADRDSQLQYNAQTGTTYTLVLTDGTPGSTTAGVSMSNTSANTLTVPTNASVAFPTGWTIPILNLNTGATTIAAAGGVTINSPGGLLTIGTQYGAAVLNKTGTNTWQFYGVALPAVVGYGRLTAQSAAGTITGATFTVGAADGSFTVSANMNVTAATVLSTTLTCTYTDESNTARSMILPVQQVGGSFIAAGAITGTGAWETPVMHIRAKAATAITLLTSAGTFTSCTFTDEGIITQIR